MRRAERVRRGASLTEALVVIMVMAAIAAALVQLHTAVLRVERQVRRERNSAAATARLHQAWRRDVAASIAAPQPIGAEAPATAEAGRPVVRLQLSGGRTVTYFDRGGSIERVEADAEQRPVRREGYGASPDLVAEVEFDAPAGRATLRLRPKSDAATAPRQRGWDLPAVVPARSEGGSTP